MSYKDHGREPGWKVRIRRDLEDRSSACPLPGAPRSEPLPEHRDSESGPTESNTSPLNRRDRELIAKTIAHQRTRHFEQRPPFNDAYGALRDHYRALKLEHLAELLDGRLAEPFQN